MSTVVAELRRPKDTRSSGAPSNAFFQKWPWSGSLVTATEMQLRRESKEMGDGVTKTKDEHKYEQALCRHTTL